MQSFKIVAVLLLGYFWLVKMNKIKILLIIKASLATLRFQLGAVAKADQNILDIFITITTTSLYN